MNSGIEEANFRIDEVTKKNIFFIDLGDLRLGQIPDKLSELVFLAELSLNDNYLVELPDWLANLTHLTLWVNNNQLTQLPNSLAVSRR